MKERPILFSAPMVRALLDGSKTQTRRIVKHKGAQPPVWATFGQELCGISATGTPHPSGIFRWSEEQIPGQPLKPLRRWPGNGDDLVYDWYAIPCPYGKPGDRLWVRESGWQRPERTSKMMREGADTWEPYYYDADGYANTEDKAQFKEWGFKRRPSIHMPRWASRILLEITAVRVERLQDISYEDALAEGAYNPAKCPLFPHTDKETPEQYARRTKFPQRWYSTLWAEINGPGSWDANPWVWVVEFRRLP